MTLVEFIKEEYPIDDKIERLKADPVQRVKDNDDLPYDCIMMIDGQLQKAVEINSETYISVLELLSYCKEDVDAMSDAEFKNVYNAYMDNVEVTDMNIASIMSAARDYMAEKKKKEDLLNKCIH